MSKNRETNGIFGDMVVLCLLSIYKALPLSEGQFIL